jgi:Spy/CpxP family protein refolding chaperone
MTRTILAGCLAMALAAGLTASKAMAQETSKPAVTTHQGGGPFAGLNLTDDQRAKIKAIREQEKKDLAAAPDKAAKMKVRKDAREKFKAVLTDEQRKQLAEKFAVARRHKMMGKIADKLGLTDEQKAQIKTIMQQARKDAQAAPDKAAKVKVMQAAREKIRTTVLTEEQRKKAEEMRARFKEHRKGAAASEPKATT